jgi:hypothetical protein
MRQLILGLGLLAVFGLVGCSGGGSGGADEKPNDDPASENNAQDDQASENTTSESITYIVSLNAAVGGSFNITDQQEVNAGSVLSATVTPDTGYSIDSVTGCNGTLTGNTYTTAAITENCSVEASFTALVVSTAKINDTGVTLCGNYDAEDERQWSSTLNCADSGATEIADGIDADGNIVPAGQDAHYGRDAMAAAGSLSKIGGGNAGFDFTRINSDGSEYTGSGDYATEPWSCVRDNVTGLIWEVKDPSNGTVGDSLQDADDRYNWYNTDSTTNGGSDGYADDDGAICYGYNSADSTTFCNTQAYRARVNTQGLCGANDWRLPKKEELRSIVHYGRTNPSIDTDYFPNTRSNWYWSGSPFASYSGNSWLVYFSYGYDGYGGRNNGDHVRLVRSAP